MMDHMSDADKDNRESKRDKSSGDDDESLDEGASSYYYDDSTNYETYRDDGDDDETAARDQTQESAFARAGATNDRYHLVRLDPKMDIVQDLSILRVTKRHVLKSNRAFR